MLSIRHELPPGLLDCAPGELPQVLAGPTLIRLDGDSGRPLFVSILLHGNETTGLLAMQRLLAEYATQALPRPLWLFVGNVRAAGAGQRRLPEQADYNRVWGAGGTPEHAMAAQVMGEVRPTRPVACIDIHNNSGRNPMYTVVARDDAAHLALAGRFSKTVLYTRSPDSTCSAAFSRLCPAVAVEAGVPGAPAGVNAVARYVRDSLESGQPAALAPDDIDLIQAVAVVKLAAACTCGEAGQDVDVMLDPDIERYNFREIAPGTRLAWVRGGHACCIDVQPFGDDKKRTWLRVENDALVTARPLMPAMLTRDPQIIAWDCLCYLMERRCRSGSTRGH